jgi:hypothetical protein
MKDSIANLRKRLLKEEEIRETLAFSLKEARAKNAAFDENYATAHRQLILDMEVRQRAALKIDQLAMKLKEPLRTECLHISAALRRAL